MLYCPKKTRVGDQFMHKIAATRIARIKAGSAKYSRKKIPEQPHLILIG
jgi:hypothetical protein